MKKLTPREQEVLVLLADGKSCDESAILMGCTESTVKNHRASIVKKTGLHGVALLTRLAVREGLVQP